MFEYRIQSWPPDWGNELHILIYGDFQSPAHDIKFPSLRITVEAGQVRDSIIQSAFCVLKARVEVFERSIEGLVEAGSRINTLLQVIAATDWGGGANGWWSHITHGSMGGGSKKLEYNELELAISSLNDLPDRVRSRVKAAIHWIRAPKKLLRLSYGSDVLLEYAGYWNAFECLVEAVCMVQPQPKLSGSEKKEALNNIFAEHGGVLSSDVVTEMHKVVNPGLVAKASHALRVCFPREQAEHYINECFRVKPESNRLYNIRNAINHGTVDAENLQELIRVEDKNGRLWYIVFGILGLLIQIPRPLDPEASQAA